jgi:hypothetical protein
MNKAEIMSVLKGHAGEIRARGVRSLYLFGSVVREKHGPESDVDLFFEYDDKKPFSLVDLLALRNYLSELLGSNTDLTTRDGLHPALRSQILTEAEQVI